MNEKFYVKKSDIKALINLYQLNGYEAMSDYLLQLLKNTDHYKLLELTEKYYPSDNGYWLRIMQGSEWIIYLVHNTDSQHNRYLEYNHITIGLKLLHLPIDFYINDNKKVLEFINSIPTYQE